MLGGFFRTKLFGREHVRKAVGIWECGGHLVGQYISKWGEEKRTIHAPAPGFANVAQVVTNVNNLLTPRALEAAMFYSSHI